MTDNDTGCDALSAASVAADPHTDLEYLEGGIFTALEITGFDFHTWIMHGTDTASWYN